MKNKNDLKSEQIKAYKTYVKTSAVGIEVALSISVGSLLGYFGDKYFSSTPYLLLFGFIVGSIAAAKRLYVFSKKYLKENKDEEND